MKRFLVFGLLLASAPAYAQPALPPEVAGIGGVIGIARNVDLNTVGDTPITVTAPGGSYILGGLGNGPVNSPYVMVSGCTAAASTAQVALYTAAAAGGTNLVSAAALTLLTVTGLYQARTGLSGTNLLFNAAAQPEMFFRVTVPQGSPVTCTVYLIGMGLP